MAALLPGPPTQLQIAVQAEGNLSNVMVTEAGNATVETPSFPPGTTDTVLVTATKIDQSAPSSVGLQVTDQAGGVTSCDPALVVIGREPGVPKRVTLHHVAHGESRVSYRNGAPGLSELRLNVNGHEFVVTHLKDGQTGTLDVSSAMRKRERNTVTIEALGPRGSTATILVSDH
jgi:hypothetical protein